MKVFCRDCKWLKWRRYSQPFCTPVDKKETMNTQWFNGEKESTYSLPIYSSPPILNKNNNCLHYKRKWRNIKRQSEIIKLERREKWKNIRRKK